MNYQQILCEVDGPVATITLNRPTRMNALTKVMETELRSAIEAVGRDSRVRAIVLVGAGKAFCAGMDMDELEVLPPEDIRAEEWMRPYDMNRRADYQPRYSYFPATPKPIISAVNGAAAGLGLIMGERLSDRSGARSAASALPKTAKCTTTDACACLPRSTTWRPNARMQS
jgi:enoyl-CoA hydratase/carnithine racemase